ncbi:YihY/virulence factor BrkB family protein [Anditalea andensis]|uniref:Ribonuclease BN n=1 Tax=Anditalea andensis TaxID=1048983 RepID=A0A074L418_9BACT|nr:YihY/virulence factor BrkB family protein [Anditalea andensis]KEO75185.1 ribonuclease BN [Anditalea andensis]
MKTRIKGYISSFDKQAQKLRSVHFGNPDQNLYDVGKVFITQLQKDEIVERASAVAFNFTVAMFPLMLFLLNIIPYIQFFFPDVSTINILGFIQEIIPSTIYLEAESTIMDIVSRPRQGLLSFGFFLALFLSTNGVVSMMNAFNACYRTRENRGFFTTRAIAISVVLVLVLDLCAAALVMIFGSQLLDLLIDQGIVTDAFAYYLVAFLRFLVLLFLFMMATSFIFRFAPAVHDRWRFFSTGSITSSLLITAGFYLFSFYLNNFATYNRLYGSIGTMIAVMLWLLITSIIILIGFEVNVALDKVAEKKPVTKFMDR